MCGIVGLLLKAPSLRPRLGEFMVPMLVGMTERGPDSAGMAVFSDSVAEGRRKLSLYCADPAFDWPRLQRSLLELLGDASFETKANHCIVTTRADEAKIRGWLTTGISSSPRAECRSQYRSLQGSRFARGGGGSLRLRPA